MIGKSLGNYEITSLLGRGGMGSVYRATDTRLDREVAVKVLPTGLTTDTERLQRFRQEAQLAAAINHPNIATVYDIGEQDGVTFIIMEFVRGEPLRELVKRGPLDTDRALEIVTGIAAGMARAHGENILHRDLKPDNVVLTDEGIPKILDFGLSKLIDTTPLTEGGAQTEQPTVVYRDDQNITRPGAVLGTITYMSPEQVQGWPVDAKADVFSFGVVLYELLSGRRPFAGDSYLDTASKILREEPEPLVAVRQDVPPELSRILERCLAKDPADRFESCQQVYEALLEFRRRLDARDAGVMAVLRRPAVIATIALIVVGFAVGATWLIQRNTRISWARNEALPEIERLFEEGDQDAAIRLMYRASEIIPDDPFLLDFVKSLGIPLALDSEPTGATVYAKGYDHPEREWILLGETPLENVAVATPTRFRVEKEGYVPFEGAPFGMRITIRLFTEEEIPPGMVYVAGGTASAREESIELEAFWMDKYEVTNRDFKAFIDDGGYLDARFWDARADRSLFVDETGRPGPAGWTLGNFPEGQDDHPVGGVSWFEASAYAAWAGKSLPTVFHWRRAAQQGIFSEILLWSNFEPRGLAPVGQYAGLGPFGTYDMAGNVREWCINSTGDARYILGGAWSDPDYLYRSTDATEPTNRLAINGFRCMMTVEPISAAAVAPLNREVYDHRLDTSVDDEVYALVRRSFDYDPRDFEARIETSDEGPEPWRHEVVSVVPAYGDERLRIHLYLPKDVAPPYQSVVYFPPSSARYLRDSSRPNFPLAYFIPASGRALVYPIYQGTYERQVDLRGPNDHRDLAIQIGKDLRRAVEYLGTREDIDAEHLAFYGLSWGAELGPVLTAIEPRFRASVLVAGYPRRRPEDWSPVAVQQNFTPRSVVPTLVINGRKDFGNPVETSIRPWFDMLGTPEEHKRLVLLDGGHVPSSPNEVIRETLDWLDRYLGPVVGGR